MKIEEVKKVIAQKTLVTYDNTDYTVTACILRLKGREWNYALELKDLKANSVRIVNMDKVKIADLTFLSKNSPFFYKWEMNC